MSSRSRRFTRLRTTAEPTARLTTKPTFGLASSGTRPAADSSRCPVRVAPPARRPERITRLNSSALLIRDCCGSTTPPASRGRSWAPGRCSDRDLLAALATARGKDGAASTGTHALTEAVDLGPPAIVRLERALAHWNSRSVRKLRCPHEGRTSHASRGQAQAGQARRHRRRRMGQPVNGMGDPRAGQTELLPGLPPGNTTISTTDLPPAT
jgi:hypothetical protein